MKKIAKIVAVLIAFVLICGLLFVANAFIGNPISKMIATNSAKKYLKETYEGTDYYIDEVNYSFKTGGYYAYIKSPSSIDTYFSVSLSTSGKIKYDGYHNVLDGFNTWQRIDEEYRKKSEEILESLPYESNIHFGTIESGDKENSKLDFGLDMKELELDKVYDINDMGSQYGKIVYYVDTDKVNADMFLEVLAEIKKRFDNENLSFYAIDLVLSYRGSEDVKDFERESIRIEDFLYSDIEDIQDDNSNMIKKIENAISETKKYYEEMDKLK